MPKTNDEIIRTLFGEPCEIFEEGCATCEVYRILATKDQEKEAAIKAERERIKREIMEQTMLNNGTDMFVQLGAALWVCDSVKEREEFTKALTSQETK